MRRKKSLHSLGKDLLLFAALVVLLGIYLAVGQSIPITLAIALPIGMIFTYRDKVIKQFTINKKCCRDNP